MKSVFLFFQFIFTTPLGFAAPQTLPLYLELGILLIRLRVFSL